MDGKMDGEMDGGAAAALTRDALEARKHAVDAGVGRRLREAREAAGLSQGAVGAALGYTFQQVQKYEKAKNRISPGNLAIVAELTGRDVAWFFGGGPDEAARTAVVRLGDLFLASGGRFTPFVDEAALFTRPEARALALRNEGCTVHAADHFDGDAFRSPASLSAELLKLRLEVAHG